MRSKPGGRASSSYAEEHCEEGKTARPKTVAEAAVMQTGTKHLHIYRPYIYKRLIGISKNRVRDFISFVGGILAAVNSYKSLGKTDLV